ncbi:MAG TPA: hypothetical protein VER33_09280 [Polyangiaceae bacterium]|nr:hypothetical protein [Polyangiaceae bacterium]
MLSRTGRFRRRCARGLFGPVALGWLLVPGAASAFERQWHVGGGAGLVSPASPYKSGGALALHAAHGVSDVFDVRLELRSSLHEAREAGQSRNTLSQGALALVYKIDVIEWVPYIGVRAGYYYLFGTPPAASLTRSGGMLGTLLGCDYAFSRSAAVGAELAYDTWLPEGSAVGMLLHAEYRWGW